MTEKDEPDTDPLVRYPLSWPTSMARRVALAANARTMPIAVWVREAIREKLERTERGDRR
jgi:hypothetical protein